MRQLWEAVLRFFRGIWKILFGRRYKIYLNGIFLAKITTKSKATTIEVEVSPGILEGGNGTGVLHVDPSPPVGTTIKVSYPQTTTLDIE